MRKLTSDEIEKVTGAVGPWGAAAGAVAGGLAYVGSQAGAGQSANVSGAIAAMTTGAVAGFYTPTTTAQFLGVAMSSLYAGLAGGYVTRFTGPNSAA